MAKRLKPTSYLFPIGFLIEVDNSNFNPNTFYSNGKWERIKGKVIVGVDENDNDFKTTGKTGGAKTHTLTVNQMPSHQHFGMKWDTTNYIRLGNNSGGGSTDMVLRYGLEGANVKERNSMITNATGGGQAHNNLQPYYVAYIWKLISYS